MMFGRFRVAMLGLPPRSLRFKLTGALAVTATVTELLLTAHQTYFEYQRLRAEALNLTATTASILAQRVDSVVANTQQELAVVAADPNFVTDTLTPDGPAMNARLGAIAGQDPDLTVIAAIDAQG